jgi:hypothetical protein
MDPDAKIAVVRGQKFPDPISIYQRVQDYDCARLLMRSCLSQVVHCFGGAFLAGDNGTYTHERTESSQRKVGPT